MTSETRRRAERPAPATAQRALALMVEIALEKGLDAVSMRDVARRAGLSLAALQHHFPSKSALVEAFVEARLQEYRQRIEGMRGGADQGGGLEILLRFAMEETLAEHRGGVFPMIEARARHDGATAAVLDRFMRFYLEAVRDALLDRQPGLPAQTAALAASALVATIEGLPTVRAAARGLGVTEDGLRDAVLAMAAMRLAR